MSSFAVWYIQIFRHGIVLPKCLSTVIMSLRTALNRTALNAVWKSAQSNKTSSIADSPLLICHTVGIGSRFTCYAALAHISQWSLTVRQPRFAFILPPVCCMFLPILEIPRFPGTSPDFLRYIRLSWDCVLDTIYLSFACRHLWATALWNSGDHMRIGMEDIQPRVQARRFACHSEAGTWYLQFDHLSLYSHVITNISNSLIVFYTS